MNLLAVLIMHLMRVNIQDKFVLILKTTIFYQFPWDESLISCLSIFVEILTIISRFPVRNIHYYWQALNCRLKNV